MTIENNAEYPKCIAEAVSSLKTQTGFDALKVKPKLAIVLGSGLGAFVDSLKDAKSVSYSNVAHMPAPTVKGHGGQWVIGSTAGNVPLLVAQGRFHLYEGHHPNIVTLPLRMMKQLGIERVILTNAAGSVNLNFKPGDFMLLDDHINMTARTPLAGIYPAEIGERFVDLSYAYDRDFNQRVLHHVLEKHPSVRLHSGVYCMMHGPQYETPAEIRMLGKLGGDAVGMSTVPETLVANQIGIKVNGVSCITNFGAGLSKNKLNHEEVAETGRLSSEHFLKILNVMIDLAANR